MGIKANFEKNLKDATQGELKMEFDKLRDKKSKIREDEDHPGQSCDKSHPDQSHEEWLEVNAEEVDEATGAGSAGGYVAPLTTTKKKKEEFEEATTSSSAGQYSTPRMWAKDDKNWKPKNDPNFPRYGGPGAKFVKVKDKCKTFPYCNQGDINALELTENKMIKETVDKVSKKTGKPKKYINDLIKKEIEELIRRGFYKSPITDMLGPKSKMNVPTGKIYSMGSDAGAKHE